MQIMMPIHPAVCLSLLVPLACRNPFERLGACTTDFRSAIEVEIRDASTGVPLAEAARGVVRDGAYVDSLRPGRSLSADPASLVSRQAAGERPGTYDVEVQRSGYQSWTVRNVSVGRGACHVETRQLRANLVRVTP